MKQEITRLLGWTELEYATFQYETGLAYLREYIPGDVEAIHALETSRIFWAWWKNHWIQRDMQFLHNISSICPVQDLRRYYLGWHDVEHLIKTIYPNAVVLHNSYAKMIDDFNKEVLHG